MAKHDKNFLEKTYYCHLLDKGIEYEDCVGCGECLAADRDTESTTPSGQAEFDLLGVEIEALKNLCKDLLVGADKCGQEPHYIVQPFLGIVKKHAATTTEHDLI